MWILFKILTLSICIGVLSFWLFKRRLGLFSLYRLFFLVWLYYALSVPIDFLVGLQIKRGLLALPDLSQEPMRAYIVIITFYYFMCAICFWLAYHTLKIPKGQTEFKKYQIALPPMWLVVGINLVMTLIYVNFAWKFMRGTRTLMANESIAFRIFITLPTIVYALNFLYIFASDNRKRSMYVMLAAVLLTSVSGARSFMIFFPFIFIMRYRLTFGKFKLVFLTLLGFLFVVYWKGIFFELQSLYITGNPFSVIDINPYTSLSSF